MCVPAVVAILPASILVRMPPRASAGFGAPGHRLDLRRDARHQRDALGAWPLPGGLS